MSTIIHDWHSPRNEACAQNADPEFDCTCEKPKRKRKPYRTIKVSDPTVPHRTSPDITVIIHPNGIIHFREKRRKMIYETTIGKIYAGLVWREAMLTAQAKKKKKKVTKK